MNFLNGTADYVVGGEWTKKAADAAQGAYGDKINVVGTSEATQLRSPAHGLEADPAPPTSTSARTRPCTATGWPTGRSTPTWSSTPAPRSCRRPHPIARTALVYAGAQKNLGPAGVVLTIVRKDLYDRIAKSVPKIWSFKALAEAKSCSTRRRRSASTSCSRSSAGSRRRAAWPRSRSATPRRPALIYDAIDNSGGFYKGTVADKAARSHMNVTFLLPSEELTDKFVKEAAKAGMVALKGYRTVGGIRASIYNAMPVEGAKALADFMGTFAKAAG